MFSYPPPTYPALHIFNLLQSSNMILQFCARALKNCWGFGSPAIVSAQSSPLQQSPTDTGGAGAVGSHDQTGVY